MFPSPVQHLISLPPRMAEAFGTLEGRTPPDWFAGHDPEGRPLGSGGGTAHLLVEGWRATGEGQPFEAWLRGRRKLVLHAGGQSRRLPAYAPAGKILMPIPVFRWGRGQRIEQTLLDVQLPHYHAVARQAPEQYVAMIASGDVLLRFDLDLPALPRVDVLGFGMRTSPGTARHFGVFFGTRGEPGTLSFFLQKPDEDRIRALAHEYPFLVDTGMWLLSARAVSRLLEQCGWDPGREEFRGGIPSVFDLYAELGPALGRQPSAPHPRLSDLTSAVVSLHHPEFHHFGTSRQMIDSLSALQFRETDLDRPGSSAFPAYPNQHLQNARVLPPIQREKNTMLWIENSVIPAGWSFAREHVLTGVPPNDWSLALEPGVCLDFVPVGDDALAVRAYGIDDRFAGSLLTPGTHWLGQPAGDWFARRGLDPEACGIPAGLDWQQAPLFPVESLATLDAGYLAWLFARVPRGSPQHAARWAGARRLSASQLHGEVRLDRVHRQRAELRTEALATMMENKDRSVFHRLDLDHAARVLSATRPCPPDSGLAGSAIEQVHDAMFRSAFLRHRGNEGWREQEERAFAILREAIVNEARLAAVHPRLGIVEDQIVWARSPVRLDLAGGWTDTPPFCLEQGGQVVNVAIDLNGQPPIQVFARIGERRRIVLRSIDLGIEESIRTYEELDTFAHPGSSFALAKAACALAGFLPRFHAQGGYGSLEKQLDAFGGGLELTLLSTVPKGSGLGTSSILAAAVLGALGQACDLGWDRGALFSRTLALEQMMTTGGGWQDQAGGLFPGLKLVETSPGLTQVPRVRWLTEHLLGPDYANRRVLLYYTGLTRLAKGILEEIVRGIFLNSPAHLETLERIAASVRPTALAVEQRDYPALAECIARTWRLKQELDEGTNPPAVQAILEAIASDLLAAALPGAGGGGFLLLLARDEDAAQRIRRRLEAHPPNPRARFVEFAVSPTGLQVTRS